MKKHPQASCVAVERGWESRFGLPLARIRSLRLRICASLCGARFFFSFSRGILGPKHVEVHEMRAGFEVDGFSEELQGYAGSDQVSAARCRGYASLVERSFQSNHDSAVRLASEINRWDFILRPTRPAGMSGGA